MYFCTAHTCKLYKYRTIILILITYIIFPQNFIKIKFITVPIILYTIIFYYNIYI